MPGSATPTPRPGSRPPPTSAELQPAVWIWHDLLDTLQARGRRHVLLEGGPRLATAFIDAGLVDEFVFYLAPTLLTAGAVVEGSSVHTLAEAYGLGCWRSAGSPTTSSSVTAQPAGSD